MYMSKFNLQILLKVVVAVIKAVVEVLSGDYNEVESINENGHA